MESSAEKVVPYRPNWIAANYEKFAKFSDSQKKFLAVYCQCFRLKRTVEESGISAQTHYYHMHTDLVYRECFFALKQEITTFLEDEAIRRGVEGIQEDVFFRDKVIGQRTIFSDSLLNTLLSANDPEKYGKRRTELTGRDGGPLSIAMFDDLLDRDGEAS